MVVPGCVTPPRAPFRCQLRGVLGPIGQTDRVNLADMSSRVLLQTYASILTELVERGVTRSRNAPVGDIAEFLVRIAYDGELAPPSEKSWDVRGSDGRKLQVKCRLVVPDSRGTQQTRRTSFGHLSYASHRCCRTPTPP